MGLEIKCTKSNDGCDWTGELREQDDHMTVCEYELIECENNCLDLEYGKPMRIMRKDLTTHLLEKCPLRFVHCEHCNKEGAYIYITRDHIIQCPEALVECDNEGCKEMIKRCKLKDRSHDCEYELVKCKYIEYGCALITKKNKLEHERDAGLHLELTLKTIDVLAKRLDTLEVTLNKLQDHNKKLDETNQMSKIKQAKLLDAVSTIDQRVQKIDYHLTYSKQPKKPPWMVPEPISSALDHPYGLIVATFKMTDYKLNIENHTIFHSPPFYTSHDGYKMKVNVQTTNILYLSICIEVVPGENDAYLTWPMSNTSINIEILNQKINRNHIPTTINLGSDCKARLNVQPVYRSVIVEDAVYLKRLTKEYTCNDTLYFRVTVHKIPTAAKPWLVCTV